MNKIVIIIILLLNINYFHAAVITVNAGESIQAAIDTANNGDTIQVAVGTYTENILVSQKSITLLGGYSADFTQRNYIQFETIVIGAVSTLSVIQLESCSNSMVDGFTIKDGFCGVRLRLWGGYVPGANNTISNCIIENNGKTGGYQNPDERITGGGIAVDHINNVTISNNIIRRNRAGRGAGIGIVTSENFIIDNNVVENNNAFGNHGGGIFVMGNGSITNNLVKDNILIFFGGDYGNGGGILAMASVEGNPEPIYFENNTWTGNYCKGLGAGVFVDEATIAFLNNELIYSNPNGISGPGSELYVGSHGIAGGSHVEVYNSTIYGDGVATKDSYLSLENCIVWGEDPSRRGFGLIVDIFNTPVLEIDYSCFDNDNMPTIGVTNIGAYNIVDSEPLFADAVNNDYHVKSTIGRWDSNTSNWVVDTVYSPTIDTGNPTNLFNLEPTPNGGRINMGCYGNTVEASKSATTLAITDALNLNNIFVFPNPTDEIISINVEKNKINGIIITDVLGKIVLEKLSSSRINLSKLSKGIYSLKINMHNGQIIHKNFFKK